MTGRGGAPGTPGVAADGEDPAMPVGEAVKAAVGRGPAQGLPAGESPVGEGPEAPAGEAVAWVRVCRLDRLLPGRGMAARVGAEQVALFRVRGPAGGDTVFAVGNRDPFSGAQVLARGIVGDAAGVPKVASPLYKQAFDLRTGVCLDDPAVSVPAYPVVVADDGWVAVGVSP